jgi:sugar/nucleoside kinase (ribokinase family)
VKAETTIGSGDVFAGVLAAALARNADLIEAARTGCAAASVSLSKQHHLLAPEDADAAQQLVTIARS